MGSKEPKTDPLETRRLSEEDVVRRSRRHRTQADPPVSLLLFFQRDGIRAVPVAEGESLLVGRSRPADLIIPDASLSRSHARIERLDGELWVEDLGSTNGTRVNGDRIERSRLEAGDSLVVGGVSAAVQSLDPLQPEGTGLETHDRFRIALQREVERARVQGDSLALIMDACPAGPLSDPANWFPRLQAASRPFDTLALYSADTVEQLRPSDSAKQAAAAAQQLIAKTPGLRCGIGVYPDNATTAEALLDVTRSALLSASDSTPEQRAAAISTEALPPVTSGGPVVCSPVMEALYATVDKLAKGRIPVLLTGETGTGKEIVARAIHDRGPRAQAPLICVNCGGIPNQLIESSLFGHEPGAFTGAQGRAQGVFEAADGGTVLLDEIGELPASAQAALLRVLETQRLCRVGSTDEIQVDVRILAATHRDLETLSREGLFREDLLYRLNAMTLKVPALRERPEEIEALARHFLAQANEENACAVVDLEPAAMACLLAHPWPGNVREMRNAITRAVVIAQSDRIQVADLPERVRGRLAPGPDSCQSGPEPSDGPVDLKTEVARYEADLILRALKACDWDRNLAAEHLGLPVRTLAYKIQAHHIRKTGPATD